MCWHPEPQHPYEHTQVKLIILKHLGGISGVDIWCKTVLCTIGEKTSSMCL